MADEHGAGVFASAKPFPSLEILLLEREAIYFQGIADSRNYRAFDKRLLQHVKD